MASKLLFLSVSLLVLFSGCLAREQFQFQNECQIDKLNAREPDDRIKSEAGTVEVWNPNHDQFRCAGVTVVKKTVERNGLSLPEYSNAPQLVFVVQGKGYGGVIVPGCAETFQEGQQQQQQGQQSRRIQDQHQKIRQFREGDVFALPAGVAHWCYNDGDEPLVVVKLLDTSSAHNQLDQSPRSFFLAGNPREEHEQLQKYMQQSLRSHEQSPRYAKEQCNNMFCGFDTRLLAEAFNVDESTARRLQSQNDKRGSIVRVKSEDLQVIRPPRISEEEREYRHERRSSSDNGIEETFCTMRLQENIGDPERADIYSPQVGRISTLNSHKLPVLNWIRLSAERGVLYRNGMMVPHWNQNAHSIMYAIRGSARVQIVNNFGQTVFDDRIQKGQVLTVPQNYAVVKRAESEGFEWISFKTNDKAVITPLSGKTSAIRAIPEQVLANAFQISHEEARRIKFNVQETTLTSARSSSERREVA